jgi:hypothetical protein
MALSAWRYSKREGLPPVYQQPAPELRVPEIKNAGAEFAKPFAAAMEKKKEREARLAELDAQMQGDILRDEMGHERDLEADQIKRERERSDKEWAMDLTLRKRGTALGERRKRVLGMMGEDAGTTAGVTAPPAVAGTTDVEWRDPNAEGLRGTKFMTYDLTTREPRYNLTDEDKNLAKNRALSEGAKNKIGDASLLNALVSDKEDEVRRERITDYEKRNPVGVDKPGSGAEKPPTYTKTEDEYVYNMAQEILGTDDPRAQQLAMRYKRSLKMNTDGVTEGPTPEEFIESELPKVLTNEELSKMDRAAKAGR